jgi:FtsH-binding integral membrane protein
VAVFCYNKRIAYFSLPMHKVFKHSKTVPAQDPVVNEIEKARFMSYVFCFLVFFLSVTALSMHLFYEDMNLVRHLFYANNGIYDHIATNGVVFLLTVPPGILVLIFLGTWRVSLYWLIPLSIAYSIATGLYLSVIGRLLGGDFSLHAFGIPMFTFGILALIGFGTQLKFKGFITTLIIFAGGILAAMVYFYFVESRYLYEISTYAMIFFTSVLVEINRADLKRTESGIKYGNLPVYHLALLGAFNIWLDFFGMAFIMLSARYSKKVVRRET